MLRHSRCIEKAILYVWFWQGLTLTFFNLNAGQVPTIFTYSKKSEQTQS